MKWLKLLNLVNLLKKLWKSLDWSRLNSRKLVAGVAGSIVTIFAVVYMAVTGATEETAAAITTWLLTWTGSYLTAQGLLDFLTRIRCLGEDMKWKSRKFWMTILMQIVSGVLAPISVELGADPVLVTTILEKVSIVLLPLLGGMTLADLGKKLQHTKFL